jgi:hypothetical protein
MACSVITIGVAAHTIYAVESPIFSPSSRSATDPLSDVLSLLKPKNYMSGGIDAGGEWCFYFEELHVTRCFALASGSCWLAMDGVSDPVRLVAGDKAWMCELGELQ